MTGIYSDDYLNLAHGMEQVLDDLELHADSHHTRSKTLLFCLSMYSDGVTSRDSMEKMAYGYYEGHSAACKCRYCI